MSMEAHLGLKIWCLLRWWVLLHMVPCHCCLSKVVGLPELKQRETTPARLFCEPVLFSPDVYGGNVVTCNEAGEKLVSRSHCQGKPPLTFSCLSLSSEKQTFKVWSDTQREFPFPLIS